MIVGRVCSRVVATASSHETIRVAAQRMAAMDVGALVVLEAADGGRPIGVVTDRDIVLRCMAVCLDPDQTEIGGIMTDQVHSVDEDDSVEDALEQMAKAGTRRLVVLGGRGRLAGILSLDDALDVMAEEAGAVRRVLGSQHHQMTSGFSLR